MRFKKWTFGILLLLSVFIKQEVSAQQVEVRINPGYGAPPPQVRIPRPGPNYVWVQGRWVWDDYYRRDVWVEGYWMLPAGNSYCDYACHLNHRHNFRGRAYHHKHGERRHHNRY